MKITLFITLNVSNGLEEKICRVIVILNSRHLLLYKYLSVSLHQITNDGDCMCYGTLHRGEVCKGFPVVIFSCSRIYGLYRTI